MKKILGIVNMVLIPEVPMLNQEQIGTGQECAFAVAAE